MTASIFGRTFGEDASGFGDPLFEIDLNLIGPEPIRNIPDLIRYEPGFSLDVLADLAFPIGEYDSEEPLNLGQNRWYGRVGAPIVWQLGPWVPGRRTTLEFLPRCGSTATTTTSWVAGFRPIPCFSSKVTSRAI